jgi:hypothetical protein
MACRAMFPFPQLDPVTGSLTMAAMGILFHFLNMPSDLVAANNFMRTLFSELKHPTRSGRSRNTSLFHSLFFAIVTPFLTAVGFGVTGYYKVAAFCFAASWVMSALTAYVGLSVFAKKPRIIWTVLISIPAAGFFLLSYFWTCPTLTVSPSDARFTHVGELYEFRVENKSDRDTYMNSFMFYFDSAAYSAEDFDFQIGGDSLKPLGKQLDGVDYGVPDIFGVLGFLPDSSSRRFFLLNVYHLAPHESRQVSIELKQYRMSTNQIVALSSEVMSHTNKAVPITRDGIVVYVPALIKRPLALTSFLVCYIKQGAHIPCVVRPSTKPPLVVAPQCISLAVVSEKEEIPKKILAGKCEP